MSFETPIQPFSDPFGDLIQDYDVDYPFLPVPVAHPVPIKEQTAASSPDSMGSFRPLSAPKGPTRVIKIHDGKADHFLSFHLTDTVAQIRRGMLEHRPLEMRENVVILTVRLNGKRLSDTGTYDDAHVFDQRNGTSLAHFPHVTDVFLYDICQGLPLRGENGVHTRLCHPKSSICEAHRKQLERAKVKRPIKDRSVSPEILSMTEEAKRRKRAEECSVSFEVLLGDACRLGQDLLTMLTAYAPMRAQIRLISNLYENMGPLSMRWPQSWQTDRILGFKLTDTVVKYFKSAHAASQEIAVRSELPDVQPDQNRVVLDARWDFDQLLTIVLLTIQATGPAYVRIQGVRKGEVAVLSEFKVQMLPAPVLFVPMLEGQKVSYDVIMVSLECHNTGRTLCHQIIKLSDPRTWSVDVTTQWFLLAERKFHEENVLEPGVSFRSQVQRMFQDNFSIKPLLEMNQMALVPLGFSLRDVVRLGEEMSAEAPCDTLIETTQYCVRSSSRR